MSAALHETAASVAPDMHQGATQLYAKIKRSSEYQHQHDGKMPFPVDFVDDAYGAHMVRSNGNRYRVTDLRFYVRVGERFVALS